MDMDAYEHGVPSWVDLGTSDPSAAAEFYSELFGWDVQQGPPEAGGYAIAHIRDRAVAGLGPQQFPGPALWRTYVNVDDADAVAEAAAANGGKVLMAAFDVLDAGRMALLADPSGAVLGVWQPGNHKGARVVNEPGSYCWSELITPDTAGARAFYQAVFGWGAASYGPDGAGGYTEFQLGDRAIAGMMQPQAGMPADVPPNWAAYFAVADA